MSDKQDQNEQEADERKPKSYRIQIDRVHYTVTQNSMTGAQLRAVPDPDIASDRDLFEVVPGHPDRKIDHTDTVAIDSGKRFFTAPAHINPGSEQ